MFFLGLLESNVSIYKQDHHILSTMTEGSVTIEIEYWIQQQHS
jgi:hypothetical protein